MDNIEPKVAIVTGSSRGIGAEIVKILASNGYNVVLNYNSSFDSAKEICDNFDNVCMFQADVSSVSEVKKLIDFTFSKFRKIDFRKSAKSYAINKICNKMFNNF